MAPESSLFVQSPRTDTKPRRGQRFGFTHLRLTVARLVKPVQDVPNHSETRTDFRISDSQSRAEESRSRCSRGTPRCAPLVALLAARLSLGGGPRFHCRPLQDGAEADFVRVPRGAVRTLAPRPPIATEGRSSYAPRPWGWAAPLDAMPLVSRSPHAAASRSSRDTCSGQNSPTARTKERSRSGSLSIRRR